MEIMLKGRTLEESIEREEETLESSWHINKTTVIISVIIRLINYTYYTRAQIRKKLKYSSVMLHLFVCIN